jgi:predicted metalloendopeptidase
VQRVGETNNMKFVRSLSLVLCVFAVATLLCDAEPFGIPGERQVSPMEEEAEEGSEFVQSAEEPEDDWAENLRLRAEHEALLQKKAMDGKVHTAQPTTQADKAAQAQPTQGDAKKMDPQAVEAMVSKQIDEQAPPCKDFYQHACGKWLKNFKLPGDHSSWTRSFSTIDKNVRKIMGDIISGKTKIGPKEVPTALMDKMKKFHSTCLNTAALEKQGMTPMLQMIQKYDSKIKDPKSFMTALAHLSEHMGSDKLFSFGIDVDAKHPLVHVTALYQGGLGLPDRKYYLKAQYKEVREKKYKPLIAFSLAQIATKQATPKPSTEHHSLAADIVAFETELAKAHLSRVAMRDPIKTYHMLSKAELYKAAPLMEDYFAARTQGAEFWQKSPKISCSAPTFFSAMSKLVSKTSAKTLKAYLQWHLARGLVFSLDDKLSQPYWKFDAQDLGGVKQRMPRAKRCMYATSGKLQDIAGRAFVAVAFKGKSKTVAASMIKQIEASFGQNLDKLGWLDEETRKKAKVKLDAVVRMIGYPSKWHEYKSAKIGDNYLENLLSLGQCANERNLKKLGKPVDRDAWDMGANEVNAYYSPETNKIVFPAAILQPPFFNAAFPESMNFGGVGVVMGHELTHGFDDQGHLYGPHGTLKSWWKKATAKKFDAKAKCVADQYSAFVLPGKPVQHVNGKLTLGENLADNGGVQNSFHAYSNWVGKQPGGWEAQKQGKYTGQQLFFYAFAQSWCTKQSNKAQHLQALTDPHSPSRFRINGPLANTPAFAEAFGCKSGDPLRPPASKRCDVWSVPPKSKK